MSQTPPDAIETIRKTVQAAEAELAGLSKPEELEAFRIKYLGTKGVLKDLMALLGQVPKEQKPAIGAELNQVKNRLTEGWEAKKGAAGAGAAPAGVDVTEPGRRRTIGRPHPLTQTIEELTDLFARMSFEVAGGPEVEDEFHNFVALNIPAQHPARDPLDNFYLSPEGTKPVGLGEGNALLLRTQTSTVQIRVMETRKPPIRVVIPGRVYRPDTHDDTHLSMFHQLEALVVDQGIDMVDLKSTILQFVKAYIGEDAKVRFRPSFFPFTEPSAEVDVWFEDKNRWIELGGCGMVHPNVLTACGIDPEVYSGWAFGFGIERLAMRKYAIPDIRLFVENDVRFLSQF